VFKIYAASLNSPKWGFLDLKFGIFKGQFSDKKKTFRHFSDSVKFRGRAVSRVGPQRHCNKCTTNPIEWSLGFGFQRILY